MRVLVACEYSGIVRDAFRAEGHEAVSCDLLPSEAPGPHVQGDVRDYLCGGVGGAACFDLIIAHPPCTYLCNSGVRWLHERPGRWEKMRAGAAFFRWFLELRPRLGLAVENPVPHHYAVEAIGRRYDQTFQPWQFGDPWTKRTCLWLRGLPPLLPTSIASGPLASPCDIPPGPGRSKMRSRFFPGVAAAMARQWGTLA